jgi:hypothetical protein
VEAIIESPWRIYPVAALAAFGVYLLWRGLRGEWRAYKMPARFDGKGVAMLRGMRLTIIGVCVIALAAAWMFQILWLAVLAAIIVGEETWETSTMIDGLTSGKNLRLRP